MSPTTRPSRGRRGRRWRRARCCRGVEPGATLADWQEQQRLHWSFQHMRELMPSQANPRQRRAPPAARDAAGRRGRDRAGLGADPRAACSGLTETDGFVLKDGAIVTELYTPPMVRRTRHLVMSVSKSIVSCVAGSLCADGLLTRGPRGDVRARARDVRLRRGPRAHRARHAHRRPFPRDLPRPGSEVRVMERSMAGRRATTATPWACTPTS